MENEKFNETENAGATSLSDPLQHKHDYKEDFTMKLFRTVETTADSGYILGDVITFALTDGEEVEALAVKQEQDGMVFVLVDCLRKEYPMNQRNTNKGGYEKCALRKKLNGEILDRFPAELREKMIAFANGDLLRLPTEREIFGANPNGEDEDDSIQLWEVMKNCRNRMAFQRSKTGTWEWYWLQNEVKDSADLFAIVSNGGNATYYSAFCALGVRPAFKI